MITGRKDPFLLSNAIIEAVYLHEINQNGKIKKECSFYVKLDDNSMNLLLSLSQTFLHNIKSSDNHAMFGKRAIKCIGDIDNIKYHKVVHDYYTDKIISNVNGIYIDVNTNGVLPVRLGVNNLDLDYLKLMTRKYTLQCNILIHPHVTISDPSSYPRLSGVKYRLNHCNIIEKIRR